MMAYVQMLGVHSIPIRHLYDDKMFKGLGCDNVDQIAILILILQEYIDLYFYFISASSKHI
jgi:hypothetical protein